MTAKAQTHGQPQLSSVQKYAREHRKKKLWKETIHVQQTNKRTIAHFRDMSSAKLKGKW